MKLSEALAISEGYLYRDGVGHGYVCLAILAAHRAGHFSEDIVQKLRQQVYRRIPGSSSLAAFLHNNKTLPREVYTPDKGPYIGYNLFHPLYLAKRDEFVNRLYYALLRQESIEGT